MEKLDIGAIIEFGSKTIVLKSLSQIMLWEYYFDYTAKCKERQPGLEKVTQRMLAVHLGVDEGILSKWLLKGDRVSYENCVILSQHLGMKIFDYKDWPRAYVVLDSKVKYLLENFELIDQEDFELFMKHQEEVIEGKKRYENQPNETSKKRGRPKKIV